MDMNDLFELLHKKFEEYQQLKDTHEGGYPHFHTHVLFGEWRDEFEKQVREDERKKVIDELPELQCEASVAVLMSNPPQFKCIRCGNTWTAGKAIDHGIPRCDYKAKYNN